MKKLVLSILTLASLSVFAQKDLEVTLNTPVDGYNIVAGRTFNISYTLKNVGMTDIPASDSIIIGITIGSQVLTASAVNHGGLAVNEAKNGALNNYAVNFTQDASGVSFCVLGVVRMNGVLLDSNTSNNAGCATVNLATTSTGVAELALANSVKVFPNPASTTFTVAMNATNATVEVMDITGKLIETAPVSLGEARLNVSSYNNGVYFYQIKGENNTLIKSGKFTVAH
jgi:hypothetical protein